MVFLFRDKSVSNIFFLLLLALAVHFHFFISPATITANNMDGVFAIALNKFVKQLDGAILFILYLVIIIVQALQLNIALNNFKMFQQQHYTVAMSYILLTGFFKEWNSITPALLSNFFVIFIYLNLCKLHNQPSPKTLLFNTGFIIGLAIIGYQPTFNLIAIAFIALAIVRPFKIAEWIILLIGILLPYYLLASSLYLSNNIEVIKKFIPWFQFHLPVQNNSVFIWMAVGALSLLVFAGFYHNQQNANRMVIQIRKSWSIIFLLLLFLLPISFIYKTANLQASFLAIVPIASIAANAFSYPKKLFFPNFLFWLCAAVIIYNNWLLVNK